MYLTHSIFQKVVASVVALLSLVFLFNLVLQPVTVSSQESNLVPSNDDLCPGGRCPGVADPQAPENEGELVNLIIRIAEFMTFVGVGLSILFMVWGGIRYITAGSSDTSETAKKILINATIGLIVSIIAYTAVTFLANILTSDYSGILNG